LAAGGAGFGIFFGAEGIDSAPFGSAPPYAGALPQLLQVDVAQLSQHVD